MNIVLLVMSCVLLTDAAFPDEGKEEQDNCAIFEDDPKPCLHAGLHFPGQERLKLNTILKSAALDGHVTNVTLTFYVPLINYINVTNLPEGGNELVTLLEDNYPVLNDTITIRLESERSNGLSFHIQIWGVQLANATTKEQYVSKLIKEKDLAPLLH